MKIVGSGGIKLGKKGSVTFHNFEKSIIKPRSILVKDTTGAGDMYAAGFLSTISKKNDYKMAGEKGTFIAEEIIKIDGAQFSKDKIDIIKDEIFE